MPNVRAMGAWGHNSFENDFALDWLADLEDSGASLLAMGLAMMMSVGARRTKVKARKIVIAMRLDNQARHVIFGCG
jgi:hypothetical protein